MHAARRWGRIGGTKGAIGGLLVACLLLLGGIVAAQDSGGGDVPGGEYTALIVREPETDAATSYVRLVLQPETGAPVVMSRQAGSRFGQDSAMVDVLSEDGWLRLPLDGLLNPDDTNIITSRGIDIAFDREGVLFAAINREFPDEGTGTARTLVRRFDPDEGVWRPVGEPFGEAPTVGPLYLFDAEPGLTLANIEGGEFQGLHVRVLDDNSWTPLGQTMLNIEPESDVETLYATVDSEGQPLAVWAEYADDFGVTLAYADYWNGRDWETVPELPRIADIEIGDVTLSGLATGPGGDVFLLTSEAFGRTSFADVWYQTTDYEFEWELLGLPDAAANSDCAVGHAIATGPDGLARYAWMEPCDNAIRLAMEDTTTGGWITLDAVMPTGELASGGPPLQLAVDAFGVVYVTWIEASGPASSDFVVGAFVPPLD